LVTDVVPDPLQKHIVKGNFLLPTFTISNPGGKQLFFPAQGAEKVLAKVLAEHLN
jgi:hypothetical protein